MADPSTGRLAPDLPEDDPADPNHLTCPVCGERAVQEKCKVICRSEKCRGRVIMNCSEF